MTTWQKNPGEDGRTVRVLLLRDGVVGYRRSMTPEGAKTLKAAAEKLAAVDVEAALLRPALGELAFTQEEPAARGVQKLARQLIALDLADLPGSSGGFLQGNFEALVSVLLQASQLRLDASAAQNRERIRNDLKAFDEVQQRAQPLVAYLQLNDPTHRATMAEEITNLRNEVKRAREEAAEIVRQGSAATIALDQITTLRDKAQQAAAKGTVAVYAESFKTAADEHKTAARCWLWALLGTVALTIVAIVAALAWLPVRKEETGAQLAEFIVSRAGVLGLLSYVVALASRNYKAHRHLEVNNRHRQLALQTFETFVGATDDKETKNAVLLEATKCIFDAGQSGYLGGKDDDPTSRIVEITKLVGGKGGE